MTTLFNPIRERGPASEIRCIFGEGSFRRRAANEFWPPGVGARDFNRKILQAAARCADHPSRGLTIRRGESI